MSKRLLIMAGGTGGHVFPGLAVAHQLQAEGWQIHWLGTADRMEAELVPAHGYPISFIDIQGVRGNGLCRLVAAADRRDCLPAAALYARLAPAHQPGVGPAAGRVCTVAVGAAGLRRCVTHRDAAKVLTLRCQQQARTIGGFFDHELFS